MHPPLWPSGFSDILIADLDSTFLTPFGPNPIRKGLLAHLKRYLAKLRKVGIPFQVWIDGSFATQKPNPNDIDLIVGVREGDIASLSDAQSELLEGLTYRRNRVILQYKVDVYLVNLDNESEQDHWITFFSTDKDQRGKKGMFRLNFSADV